MNRDVSCGPNAQTSPPARVATGEIVSLRSFVDDGGARLTHLLSRLGAQGMGAFRLSKVRPSEISHELLETLRLRPAGEHSLYAATAHSN